MTDLTHFLVLGKVLRLICTLLCVLWYIMVSVRSIAQGLFLQIPKRLQSCQHRFSRGKQVARETTPRPIIFLNFLEIDLLFYAK